MTSRPISTISYNTESFLQERLNQWVDAHLIQCYMYIKHKGEDGDKDHIHLRIEPNKSLDPMKLTEELREYEKGSDKPLGCRPWRPSKEEDWYLYAVHDKDYLGLKYGGGQKGEKMPYDWDCIKVSQYYDLETAIIRARQSLTHSTANMVKRLRSGTTPTNLIEEGENVHTINAVVRALNATDYQRLTKRYHDLYCKYESLTDELLKIGYIIDIELNENGEKTNNVKLKKVVAGTTTKAIS